jgi:hypothetical protein
MKTSMAVQHKTKTIRSNMLHHYLSQMQETAVKSQL